MSNTKMKLEDLYPFNSETDSLFYAKDIYDADKKAAKMFIEMGHSKKETLIAFCEMLKNPSSITEISRYEAILKDINPNTT